LYLSGQRDDTCSFGRLTSVLVSSTIGTPTGKGPGAIFPPRRKFPRPGLFRRQEAKGERNVSWIVVIVVVVVTVGVLVVLGAGVAVLVYFLTRQKNGSEKERDEPRSRQRPPRQMPDNPPSP